MEVLQVIFYIMGILFMLAWILLLSVISYTVWQIYKMIQVAPQEIQNTISAKFSEFTSSNKGQLLSMAGVVVSSLLMAKLKNFMKKK